MCFAVRGNTLACIVDQNKEIAAFQADLVVPVPVSASFVNRLAVFVGNYTAAID